MTGCPANWPTGQLANWKCVDCNPSNMCSPLSFLNGSREAARHRIVLPQLEGDICREKKTKQKQIVEIVLLLQHGKKTVNPWPPVACIAAMSHPQQPLPVFNANFISYFHLVQSILSHNHKVCKHLHYISKLLSTGAIKSAGFCII